MIQSARNFAVLTLAAVTVAAHADYPYLSAFQGLYLGNGPYAFAAADGHGGANDASNPFVTNQSYTGLDSQGNSQTMTISGSAYSSSSYGAIHIFGEGTVTNPYFNPANAPYYDGSSDPNPNGSPESIGLHGNAGWGDTLTYTGFQGTGYLVNYYFQLHGSVSGDTEAGLNFSTSATNAPSYNPRTKNGNALWITPDYQVDWGVAFNIDVDFYAGLTTFVSQHTEGETITGYADYANTLELVGIGIKDANGNAVTGWTVSSASGALYPTQAVPEPAAFVAFGLGALGVVRRRRRVR